MCVGHSKGGRHTQEGYKAYHTTHLRMCVCVSHTTYKDVCVYESGWDVLQGSFPQEATKPYVTYIHVGVCMCTNICVYEGVTHDRAK